MQAKSEVIALVMPDAEAADAQSANRLAMMLIRGADGRISLETVDDSSAFDRHAMTTGCFRKGKPIVDPVSRQVVGYEMEMVPPPLAATA